MDIPTLEANDNPHPHHIDSEHQVQLGLINALGDAVEAEQDAASIQEILDQLVAFSELHFMSEQLLMRMYAYAYYDDHVRDHEEMTERLRQVRDNVVSGRQEIALRAVQTLRDFLIWHINSRDRQLTDYLQRVQGEFD